MSNYFNALSAIEASINGLSLAIGGQTVTVNIRKLPKREEGLDPATQILVVPSETPERVEQFAYPNQVNVAYSCQIVVINPNDGDQITNLPTYLDWRQSIRELFQGPPLTTVSGCWMTKIVPGRPLDREKINLNYDYLDLSVEVYCVEVRRFPGT